MNYLKNIILIGVLFACSSSFAEEIEISDIERSLLNKKRSNAESTQVAPSPEVDALLDKLVQDHAQKREEAKQRGEQVQMEDSKKEGLKVGRAELIILNKITAKSVRVNIALGEVRFFGNLSVEVHRCIKNPDPMDNNNFMLLSAFDHKIDDDNVSIFHGWMLSSNPSVSTVEHPVYEIFPVNCIAAE
jgi:hypothetical protein